MNDACGIHGENVKCKIYRNHLRELNMDGRIILKHILEKQGMNISVQTTYSWLRMGPSGGLSRE
jgi:hypothetical protein